MDIIDVHQHIFIDSDYPEDLLREMDKLGIEKCCIAPMGPLFEGCFNISSWSEVETHPLLKAHPDRLVGYAFIRLGDDTVEKARRWHEEGFSGLKFYIPRGPYDSEEFFPVYRYAEAHDLPCLFHSGIFDQMRHLKGQGLAIKNHHPEHIEAVSNEFPDLKIIIAHLGVAYAEVTCSILRCRPNVYADMSGRLDGWRCSKPAGWFQEMFFWQNAADKLLFGSDCLISEMSDQLSDQLHIVSDYLKWDEIRQNKFLFENARRVFGFE